MPAKKDMPVVLTVLEVAKILRIAKMSVYHAIARGDLPAIRVGRRILIPRFALEQMLITPVQNRSHDRGGRSQIVMRGDVRKYELKDGTKRWAAVVYQGKRVASTGKLKDSYRWIRGFQTQKAAQSQLTKVLKSVGDGTYTEPSKHTLAEFLGRWLKTV